MLTYADLDPVKAPLQQECAGGGLARLLGSGLLIYGVALAVMHVIL